MKVLYIEDSESDADLARWSFSRNAPDVELVVVTTLAAGRRELASGTDYAALLLDLNLPDGNGMAFLADMLDLGKSIPLVVLTGSGDQETALSALRAGADDYVTKRNDYLDMLPAALLGAVERYRENARRRGGRRRVIYAEPNAFDADLARRHFARHSPNVRLEVVLSSADVLSRLSDIETHSSVDAFVLDYQIPGLDGLELARILRLQHGLDTPIVLLTGHGSGEVAAKALRLGVDDYLPKREGYLFELAATLEKLQHQRDLMRERAELAETSRRFGYLLSTSPTVLYNLRVISGQSLAPLWISENIARITGHTAADVMTRRWWVDNLHPDDRAATLSAQRSLFDRGSLSQEYRFRNGAGEYMWVRDEQRLVRDTDGNPLEVVGTWQLIDEQKRSELQLTESEQRFRTLFEHTPAISVQGYDRDRRVIYWNRASELIYGYTADEAMGCRLEDLIIPDQMREYVAEAVDQWVNGGKEVPASELTLLRKDGSATSVFSSHVMLNNIHGEPEMYCIDVDLNEQKRASEELVRSEARYRRVVESVNEVIFLVDGAGRWVFLNPAWERLTGFSIAESIGQKFLDFVHPDDRAESRAAFEALRRGETDTCHIEGRCIVRGGETRWVDVFARAGGDDGAEAGGISGTLSDVTERVEQRFMQQARADILNQVVADEPLLNVLGAVAEHVEKMRPEMRVLILLLDRDSGCLGSPVAPSLPEFFSNAFDGVAPGELQGACGAAAWTGRPVVVPDIQEHPVCETYASLASRAGVRACWSRPLMEDGGGVLGTFSVYYAEPHEPDDVEFGVIDEFANLTIVALQKCRAGEAVRHREAALEMSANAVLEMLAEPDLDVALAKVLETVGRCIGVDRAFVYEVHPHPETGEPASSRRHRWVSHDGLPEYPEAEMQNIEFAKVGFQRWLDVLSAGGLIVGDVCDFPDRERELLEGQRVVSIIVAPIFQGERLWGLVGLDVAARRKVWSQSEESVLRILATSISAAIERRSAVEDLRRSAAAFESIRDGVVITDLAGTIVAVNRAYSEITGYPEDEVLGRNPGIVRSGRQPDAFYREMWRAITENGHWEGEIWNRRKSGEVCPQWLTISTVRAASGAPTHYVGVMTDISQLKQSEAELERLAHYDPLTDLPNRVLVRLRLEHAIEHAKRNGHGIGVLFIDLDRFQNVNDSYGHPVGDELLVKIARRLKARLRGEDTLARLGGDEFLLVMERMGNPSEAAVVAQTVIGMLDEPFALSGGQEVYIGSSVGISLFPDDADNPTELIQHADAALYQAKADGRSTYRFFTAQLSQSAQKRIELETRLRRALERGEFELHYQPQIDIPSGRIVGCEALLRWRDPERGLIAPGQFIAIAEDTGLIVALGEWAIRSACEQGRRWLDEGLPRITVAVNMSGRQLWQSDLSERIGAIISETGFDPTSLELELTESTIMGFEEVAGERLHALKKLGLTLALDDFGTGYSSLAYLKRFPIDVLKIDREFVRDIPEDSGDMEIAAAIVAMAHTLKMKVVAEGVETREQLAFLRSQSCDLCQGFLFSTPVPADEFAKLLAEDDCVIE